MPRPIVGRAGRGRAGARRARAVAPQYFWLWAPVNFDDVCTHFDVNEHADGQHWHHSGFCAPVLGEPASDPVLDTGGLSVSAQPMASVDCKSTGRPAPPPPAPRSR